MQLKLFPTKQSLHILDATAANDDVIKPNPTTCFHSRQNVTMSHRCLNEQQVQPVSAETIRRHRRTAAKLLPKLTPVVSSVSVLNLLPPPPPSPSPMIISNATTLAPSSDSSDSSVVYGAFAELPGEFLKFVAKIWN